MSSHYPKRLYKFFGEERTNFLKDRLIRFTQLDAFNDPFEGRPHFSGLISRQELEREAEKELIAQLNASYDSAGALYLRFGTTREEYIRLGLKSFQDQKENLLANIDAQTPNFVSEVQRRLLNVAGALCLSEVWDSILMWSHYASSHSGFAVEFNGSHPYFHGQLSEDDEFRHIRRVQYKDTRPSGTMSDIFDEGGLFFVKSNHWSYEREWRMLMPLNLADKFVAVKPYPVCLFEIPADAISAVILGARCRPETQSVVESAIAQPELKHVQLKRAIPDEYHFALRLN